MSQMNESGKSIAELFSEIKRLKAEADYYKRIAELAGQKRLRENAQLSALLEERQLAEEKRKKLEAEIQQAKKMEAIGMLAGGVAHDLNNILGAIVGYPDLILMQIPQDSPAIKQILAMRDSGKKASAIVNDLLTMARRGLEKKKAINLNTVIEEYLSSPVYEKVEEYHPKIIVTCCLDEKLPPISGSQTHLSKVIMNLISNAAESMPKGGKLEISTRHTQSERTEMISGHMPKGDYVVLSVKDTGVGISDKDMKRIFEPFFTKKIMGRSGTGLGMSVVWSTIKDHKGHIDIKSALNKGTGFKIFFPVATQRIEVQKIPRTPQACMGAGESILVVDDINEQRDVATSMLSSLGYVVDAVPSGEDAVLYVQKKSVNLLILDMIMDPGIGGVETLRRIRKIHPEQKAIIVSGYSGTNQINKTRELGAGCFLKKPFLLEEIAQAVKAELKK